MVTSSLFGDEAPRRPVIRTGRFERACWFLRQELKSPMKKDLLYSLTSV